jgi:glycosyltransferase involved in cell wall biosynthesis
MSSSTKRNITNNNNPLITFALFTYNQEKYIGEALEAAFTQDYSPLEIILSDDCSSDQTFEYMKRIAFEYNGPHKIILNLANGELIIIAAGDDISLPNRARRISSAWKLSGASAIYSESHIIDSNGSTVGYWKLPKNIDSLTKLDCNNKFKPVSFYGAAAAYSADIFEKFGDLPQDIRNEDYNLAMRAVLMDGIHYINEPLLSYRKHTENLSFWVKQSKTKNPLLKTFLMAQSMENLTNNQSHILKYINLCCGNNSRLLDAFKHHMISTSVRCRLLYGFSGKFKRSKIKKISSSRFTYLLIIIKELFVTPIFLIKNILRAK